jgi:epoxyqueuosine reductase
MGLVTELRDAVDPDVRFGVTDFAPFPEVATAIRQRVDSGLHGGLGFTYGDPDGSANPLRHFPWASSIVVAAVPYLAAGDGVSPSPPRSVARFADGDRYERVRATLDAVTGVLRSNGYRTEQVYDDDRLVDRAVAVRAGVAWNGKSTMALTPGHGPWFLIGSVVTDADLDPSSPMVRDCGTCVACIPACPTDAIIAPGVLDASRCLAAVLQRPGPIPDELRVAVGARIYGCDECLVACPPGDRALKAVSHRDSRLEPADVLGLADNELSVIAAHWYVPKRNMRFVRRNALVALGNVGDESHVGILAGHLGHPDSLLRSHAAWALGQVAVRHSYDETAPSVLRSALMSEESDIVRDDIAAALARQMNSQ